MTDLEDKILKKNVPGRFSTFWKDEKDFENENESAASDYAHHELFQDNIKISSQSNRVSINRSVNTGIKGILSDYRNHQEDIQLRNEKLRSGKIEEYHRAARGPELKSGEQSISISSTIKTNDKGNHTDVSDSDSDIELDEDVLSSYRSKRFQHLHQVQSLPSFGHVTELQDANEFSEVIDDTDSRVCCIFHLYDNSIAQISTLFDFPFDPCGLPSLLVYKNGVEVANLTPVTERIENTMENGYRFTVEDVEKVLRDVGVCD